MSNAIGISNSPGSVGGLTITIPGTLAIGSNLGQLPAFFNAAKTLQGATVAVGTAPTGASLVVQVQALTSPPATVFTLTITSGNTLVEASAAQIAAAAAIPANALVLVNITAVGTTFPGADLTLNLF